MKKEHCIAGGAKMFISKQARWAYARLAEAMGEHGEPVCSQTDPEEWFPEKGGSNTYAKKHCHQCPLKDPCLQFALLNNELHGIWGGVAPRQRQKMAGRGKGRPHGRTDAVYRD